jgi:hypothetical protein
MKLKMFIVLLLGISTTLFLACNKDASQSQLSVHLTDAPGEWDEVNIDLKEVQVKLSKDTTKWMTLETVQGIYNLLGLQNGIDSVIAQGSFASNSIVKEIRLVVGTNNSITINGQTFSLTIPSGAETGLKIKVDKHLSASLENLTIDFDASLSIAQEADGYKLRPVIRLK